MSFDLEPAVTFGALLRQNPKAARFYDRCTPEQRQAILLQLPEMKTESQLRAFVDNLPSATL